MVRSIPVRPVGRQGRGASLLAVVTRAGKGQQAVALLAAVAVVSLLAGLGLSRLVQSPAARAAALAPPTAGLITVPVEKRVVASTVQIRADVGYEDPVDLRYDPGQAGGAGIVSGRVPTAGDQLEAGGVALEVDGRPVIVLPGDVPAYRDLRSDLSGQDVQQLRTALRSIGIDGGSPSNQKYDAALAAAVKKLYERVGYPAPGDPTATPLPASEVVFVPSLPRRVDAVNVTRGQPVTTVFATVSGTGIRATGTVSTDDAGLISVGTAGTITVGDETLDVTVAQIDEATTVSDKGDKRPDPAHKQVVLAFGELTADQTAALRYTNVRVRLPVRATDDQVLAVPLSALSIGPDGDSRIEVMDDDGTTRLVPVTTGLAADGYAEIASSAQPVEPGDLVVVGTDTTEGDR